MHWRDRWAWGPHRGGRRPDDIAGESEAFLGGRMAAWLDLHGRPVPAWAWLNFLAHAGLDEMVSIRRHRWGRRLSRSWANGFLVPMAAELASLSQGADTRLVELQRKFLWPLELRMASGSGPECAGPLELAALVRTALGYGPGRSVPLSGSYPAPPVGRTLGHGRINRIALGLLGPASVARRPTPSSSGIDRPPPPRPEA